MKCNLRSSCSISFISVLHVRLLDAIFLLTYFSSKAATHIRAVEPRLLLGMDDVFGSTVTVVADEAAEDHKTKTAHRRPASELLASWIASDRPHFITLSSSLAVRSSARELVHELDSVMEFGL